MTDKENKKLIDELKGLKGPVLGNEQRKGIKKNLFAKMDAFSSARFSVERADKVRIKERIMNVLCLRRQRWFFGPRRVLDFGFGNPKMSFVTSFVLVIALVFGMFNFLQTENDIVSAATFTSLRDYDGEVFVKRGGEILEIYEGMHLLEGDVVYTFAGGRAIIEYFDSSVSRLSGETEIVLTRLEDVGESSGLGGIEIFVVRGIIWSKVLNLTNSHLFFSVEAKGIRASAERAAFNFRVDENELEIGVFGNSVEVEDKEEINRLVSGKKLLVSNGDSRHKEIMDVVYDEDDEWISGNLEYDRRYLSEVENRLLRARAEAVGIDIDDKISFNRSLKDNALLFFTFDDVKSRKLELDLAEKDFIAAQIKLRHNELDDEEIAEINAVVETFAKRVRDFYDFAEKIAYTDEEYSESLKAYVADKVTVNKRDLGVVMPDSPVYVARSVMEDLDPMREDFADFDEERLFYAVNRLLNVDDIFYRNAEFWDSKLASEYVEGAFRILSFVEERGEDMLELKSLFLAKIYEDVDTLIDMGVVLEEDIVALVEETVEDPVEDVVIASLEDGKTTDIEDDDVAEKIEKDDEEEKDEEDVDELGDGYVIKGPYGVSIYDDKPLGPMLE